MEKIETYVITVRRVEKSCVPLNLTEFEKVILSGLIDGKRQKEIAAECRCTQQLVSKSLKNAIEKNGCKSELELCCKMQLSEENTT